MAETPAQPNPDKPTRKLTLQRLVVEDFGAFGVLKTSTPGEPERILTCTLERTYRSQAEAGQSQVYVRPSTPSQFVKVTHGVWTCRRSWFVRGGYRTFEVMAPGHSQILFHKGAIEDHSEGCILLGTGFSLTPLGIVGSSEALQRFQDYTLGLTEFLLEVRQ